VFVCGEGSCGTRTWICLRFCLALLTTGLHGHGLSRAGCFSVSGVNLVLYCTFERFFFLAVFWTRRPPWQCSAIRLWIQARLHPFNTTTPNNQHEKSRKNNGDVALRCPVAAEGEHALNKYGSSPIDVMVKTVTSSRWLHWADARLDRCYK
jgi:hypothetical protein